MNYNLNQAKILFNTLLEAKLDSSLEYTVYEKTFLPIMLSCAGGIDRIIESFKLDVMQGNSEACYIIANTYKIGFYNQQKNEYTADLCTLVGHKLKNRKCTKIVQSNTAQYEIFEDTANKFINDYISGNGYTSFDDAILLAHLPYDNINNLTPY